MFKVSVLHLLSLMNPRQLRRGCRSKHFRDFFLVDPDAPTDKLRRTLDGVGVGA